MLPMKSNKVMKITKHLEAEIKKLTKTRLNDRTTGSWKSLKELKKRKLQLKDKIAQLTQ